MAGLSKRSGQLAKTLSRFCEFHDASCAPPALVLVLVLVHPNWVGAGSPKQPSLVILWTAGDETFDASLRRVLLGVSLRNTLFR